jgi:hypothetical protein
MLNSTNSFYSFRNSSINYFSKLLNFIPKSNLSKMDFIQSFVQENTHILLPVFRTTTALIGLAMVGTGSWALLQPAPAASSFGIPIHSASTSPDARLKTDSAEPRNRAELGWVKAFAGREMALGVGILSLLYFDELRALSILVICTLPVGACDVAAVGWYGSEGVYKNHLYPSIFFSVGSNFYIKLLSVYNGSRGPFFFLGTYSANLMKWMGPLGLLLSSKV